MNNKAQYRLFCQTEEIPIFSQDWHLDAVCQDGEWDVALVEKAGKVVASLPYFLKKKSFFQYISMPWLTKTMGPYIVADFKKPNKEHKIVKSLIEQLPKVAHFNQDCHYDFTDWLPFYWKKYKQTTKYSYVIDDLSDEAIVFSKLSGDYRNNKIKKAKELVTIKMDEDVAAFYKIQKLSFERQGKNLPIPFEFIKNYDDVLAKNNARKIFFAIGKDAQVHSAAYLIWDENTAYYHMAGDDPDLRSSGAGILLVWEAIRYTRNVLKLNCFDFEGSMIPSIEKVRRNFGAVQKPYFNIEKFDSTLFKILRGLK